MPLIACEEREYREAYLATAGDGKTLGYQEAVELLQHMGWINGSHKVFGFLENNNKGDHDNSEISIENFISAINQQPETNVQEAILRRSFAAMNVHGTDKVSPEDIKLFVHSYREKYWGVPMCLVTLQIEVRTCGYEPEDRQLSLDELLCIAQGNHFNIQG